MKPIISLYAGHDASIVVYCQKTNQFIIYEFERLNKVKHYQPYHPLDNPSGDITIATVKKILHSLKKNFNINNDFSYFITDSVPSQNLIMELAQVINFERFITALDKDSVSHHSSHVLSCYMQSNFDKCFAISSDGYGQNTSFRVASVEKGKIYYNKNEIYMLGWLFDTGMTHVSYLGKTHAQDRAGKVMGLSSYGKPVKKFYPYLEELSYLKDNGLRETTAIEKEYWQKFTKDTDGIFAKTKNTNTYPSLKKFKSSRRKAPKELCDIDFNKESDENCAATLQSFFEENLIKLIKEKYLPKIRECGNNLILSGGTAMNVVTNQKIREEFPDINLYISPNPSDSGLGLGHLYNFLIKRNLIEKYNGYDLKFAGAPLDDLEEIDNINHVIISENELAQKLKDGKIIGIIKGNSEVGPRALGNRSILCDPSYPNMKDIINSKVKFREHFRPFAPMCNIESVETFFESVSFKNMEHMSFIAYVKPEWREKLAAITHVDNTARLQTVTKNSDPVIHSLLKTFGGPLLNTSFNIQGKPILNSIKDSITMLKNTKLDGVVVYRDDKYHYYDRNILGLK